MERIDPASLTFGLLQAPGWARVGLTAPTARLREKAALELVSTLIDTLEHPVHAMDENQLSLPI